jgi:hypothetical protein
MGRGITYSFVVEERRRKLSFQGKGNGRLGKKIIYMWCVVFFFSLHPRPSSDWEGERE